jgi:site-specific DNA-methyltransferase (adenine-specific)
MELCPNLPKKYFQLVYGDCLYEKEDFGWLFWAMDLVKDSGLLIIQTDYHTVADYKNEMVDYNDFTFVNWLIYINDWGGTPKNRFAQKHDDILVYCRGDSWKWYPERIQIPKVTAGTAFDKKGTGTKTPPSVFYDHASFSTMSNERVQVGDKCFSMQKPEWLMERLLLPFTDENDEVLDLFAGTGTLGVVCKKYNRNYTGIEIDNTLFTKAGLRINRCDTPTNV